MIQKTGAAFRTLLSSSVHTGLAIALFVAPASAQFMTDPIEEKDAWLSFDAYGGHLMMFGNCVGDQKAKGKSEDEIDAACHDLRLGAEWRMRAYEMCVDRLLSEAHIPTLASPGYADPELQFLNTRIHIGEKLAYDLGLSKQVRQTCLK